MKARPFPRLERFIKRILWLRPTRVLRANTQRGIRIAEQLLPQLEGQYKRAIGIGLAKYGPLYNGMCFVLLLYYDFSVLALLHATEVDANKQNLLARQLCTLLYEATTDLPAVLGKDFRSALHCLPSGDKHQKSLSEELKTLTVFRRENEDRLKTIRNLVAAHRDHNALAQLDIINEIDSIQMVRVASQFTELLGRLARVLTPILEEMGQPAVMLQTLIRN